MRMANRFKEGRGIVIVRNEDLEVSLFPVYDPNKVLTDCTSCSSFNMCPLKVLLMLRHPCQV